MAFVNETELLNKYPFKVTIAKDYKEQEEFVIFLKDHFGPFAFWQEQNKARWFDDSCRWILNYATILSVDYHFKHEHEALFFLFSTS